MKYPQRAAWLVRRLNDRLPAYGFVHLPQRHQFRKVSNNGFQNIIYNSTDYDDLSIVDLFIGIRNNLVEDLALPYLDGASPYLNDLNTIVTSIRPFLADMPGRFEINTPKDAEKVVDQSLHFLEEKGFDLLDELSDLDRLCTLLNNQSTSKVTWSANAYHHAVRAMITARLTYHPDFDTLVAFYLEELQKKYVAPKYLDRYRALIAFLKQYSVN